jgi:hypothetical protein
LSFFDDDEPEGHGCDCCALCVSGSCCGSYPEYCCCGWCGERGKQGHYKVETAPDPAYPDESYPERIHEDARQREAAREALRGAIIKALAMPLTDQSGQPVNWTRHGLRHLADLERYPRPLDRRDGRRAGPRALGHRACHRWARAPRDGHARAGGRCSMKATKLPARIEQAIQAFGGAHGTLYSAQLRRLLVETIRESLDEAYARGHREGVQHARVAPTAAQRRHPDDGRRKPIPTKGGAG